MKLFKIEFERDQTLHMFARSFDHAAEQFVTWQMVNEITVGDFKINLERSQFMSRVEERDLRDAISMGLDGLGTYDEVQGWIIKPIADERDLDEPE